MKMQIVGLNMEKVKDEFAKAYVMHVDEQFETEGEHFLRKKWPPLSKFYKRKKGETGRAKILQDTGRMVRSTDYKVVKNIIMFTNNRRNETGVPLGKVHNRGATIRQIIPRTIKVRKIIIPARPFFVWNDWVQEIMLLELKEIIERGA